MDIVILLGSLAMATVVLYFIVAFILKAIRMVLGVDRREAQLSEGNEMTRRQVEAIEEQNRLKRIELGLEESETDEEITGPSR